MDPDKCLDELMDLVVDLRRHLDGHNELSGDEFTEKVDDLVNHIFSLHGWMMGGGFRPKRWQVADKG